MAHPNRLNNARVLVFGGTSGIGFAVANMALSNNAEVIISGSTSTKVSEKLSLLKSYYPSVPSAQISGIAVDLSDLDNLEKNLVELFETATEGGAKKIDHIVFTAGDVPSRPKTSELTVDTLNSGSKIRYYSPLIIAKLLMIGKYMPISPKSSFTVTGGTNTHKPMPNWSVGAAMGGQIEAMARGLAVDLKPVRVNLAEPGAIRTELWDRFGDAKEGMEEAFAKQTLTGALGTPEDTAEAYRWFVCDWFVTGGVASSNGGRMLA